MEAVDAAVRIVSRRMVRPYNSDLPTVPPQPAEDIHLTLWDLNLITIDYIQNGILLPKPPGAGGERLVDTLAASLARTLGRYYEFAGRLAVDERGDGTIVIPLRCTGEGAELVHTAAPGVATADIVGSVYTPSVVCAFFPLNGVLCADAAIESLPILSAQVTELADGVFIGVSMNHTVGDGTAFWAFLNTWSAINRGGISEISTPAPVHARWFTGTSPVPVPLPFGKLQHVVRRFDLPPVQEGFFTFSAGSVKKLKARANEEMASVTISSLQALLAHLWRALCRARRLPPGKETWCSLIIGLRERVNGIPPGYLGNAMAAAVATCTVGEILDNGLGWMAWQLNRAVASFDEATVREQLDCWARAPDFPYMGTFSSGGDILMTGGSPRFDVFGNDFGWGKPVGVRNGRGNKIDGKTTGFQGPERGGSMSLGVCVTPDVLERLVADDEFMDAVMSPAP